MLASMASDTAAEVKRNGGARTVHTPSADILRPMVEHASFVPSDLESPRYGLPSADYMRRFRKAAQADDGASGGTMVPQPPPAAAPAGGRASPAFIVLGSVLVLTCMGAFAALAVVATTSLALAECSQHTHPADGPPATGGGGPAPARFVLPEGPCIGVLDEGAGCPTPAHWLPWADVNATGGQCCVPAGFTCADAEVGGACPTGSLHVTQPADGLAEQCCHYAGLSDETLNTRTLAATIARAKSEVEAVPLLDLSEADAAVLFGQLKVLEQALQEASGILSETLESVGDVKAAAEEQMGKPSPPPFPPPSPSPAPPPSPSPAPPSPAQPAPTTGADEGDETTAT